MNIAKIHRAWYLLRTTYTAVPIIIGLDKCFTWLLVNWNIYTSPLIAEYLPALVSTHLIVISGVIEIAAGLLVWFYPRFGAYLVAAWMLLIVADLATLHNFYDIMARDMVIAIGALGLAWLSEGLNK